MRDELVVERGTHVRQAGATQADGAWVDDVRRACERELYVFCRVILERTYLVPHLHLRVARWLQQRWLHLLLLMPRGHGKTTLVSHGLPLHCFVQPREKNIYFPGTPGYETRLILIQQTLKRGQDALRIQVDCLTNNALFRAFWPHLIWANPKRDAKKWNDEEYILPGNRYPDPSMRCLGTGAAIAGAHPSAIIKDDYIAEREANSPLEMEAAVTYQKTVRAVINEAWQREWDIGTRWAIYDSYATHHLTDPRIRSLVLAIVEDGRPLWPERVTLTDAEAEAWNAQYPDDPQRWKRSVDSYRRESGIYFPLFYLNQPYDASLTDFHADQLRTYTEEADGSLVFPVDARDARLAAVHTAPQPAARAPGRHPPDTPAGYDARSPHGRAVGDVRRWRR